MLKFDIIDEWYKFWIEVFGCFWCELIKIIKFKWFYWKKNYCLMSNKVMNKKLIIYKSIKIGRDVR